MLRQHTVAHLWRNYGKEIIIFEDNEHFDEIN